ncbi:hypothetical protein CORC01_13053 [Colletotrichum orchidophilum]|uniref:Uncharacterized protein n=1 Tax=Colletotrichum orchidophilum TaxID=1209926 RepID=A0A1G4ARE0_9PEZI|nr:uncharacterized protein CORC01_13053 [Colletotrichum orchidophilum]OHE91663.1 hypothetical protein CORC01_13053 [Colletotrichum orchidophilum]
MEDDYIQKARVSPHWISEAKTFWYRQNLSSDRFAFIYVNAIEKQRRPAFDHDKLAKVLGEKTNQKDGEIEAFKLPFTWIDLENDVSSVRFFHEGKKWCFDIEGNLGEWEASLNLPKTPFISKERASVRSNHPVTITFVNNSDADLRKCWIDWEGKSIPYGKISRGASGTQKTYAGHVWKFVDDKLATVKAIYATPEEVVCSVVIDEQSMDGLSSQSSEEDIPEDNDEKGRLDPNEKSPLGLFVRDFDLWHRDEDERESRLSYNGTNDNQYDDSKIWVSPDKKFCIAWQFVPEEDHQVHLRDSAPKDQTEPQTKIIRYLKAGDRVRVDRPRLFDLESKKEVATNSTLFHTPYELRNSGWNRDASEYRFIYNERGHQLLRVVGINVEGVVRSLVEERSDTFIDYSTKLNRHLIRDTDEFIWAKQGYVVVQIDGMGTNWRSKKFHDVCWKNLKDAGFPDRISWIKAAAETRPWMDTSRVGIFGGSAGGQNAVGALLFHGHFYKAAVADCGCHNNRMDKIWWNEQWMGYPVDKSYEDSSNVVHASKLTGALLLIVAEMDDNVDPASTLQLVKALNDADKDYEFLYMPGAQHCSGRTKYALQRQERFFRRHLQGPG